MKLSRVLLTFLVGIIGISLEVSAAPKKVFDPLHSHILSQAGVPMMESRPVIDGKVDEQEWKDAVSITGFAMTGSVYVLPQQLQGRIYIGYDTTHLYLGLIQPKLAKALKSDRLPGGRNSSAGVYWSNPHWWLKFHTPKKGYEFMLVPSGDLRDRDNASSHSMNQGLNWNSGAVVKTNIEESRWTAEMKIPFAPMGYPGGPPLNERWRVHLMYSDRSGYMNEAEWNAVENFRDNRCGHLIFSGKVPAFQLLDTGRLEKLEFAPRIRLSNPTGKKQSIDVKIAIASWKDILIDRSRKLTLKPGESREIAFEKESITLPKDRTARMEIDVNTPTDHLYSAWLQLDELNFTRFNDLLSFGLKDPDFAEHWELKCANYPYYKSMDVWANCKYNHLPAAVQAASSCRVLLRDAKSKRKIRQGNIPLRDGKGRIAWTELNLPDGEYEILGRLYSGNKTVSRTMIHKFERRVFPWEHNKIGISDKVYPPFTPIKDSKSARKRIRTFSPWGRTYEVGYNALPGRIIATRETPVPGQVICGRMRLDLTSRGKTKEIKGKTTVTSVEPGIVKMKSSSSRGSLKVNVSSFMQYDGWYQATMKIAPTSPVNIDKLELVIPFGEYADTYYGYRRSWLYGALPKGTGVIWKNVGFAQPGTLAGAKPNECLFVPSLAVGNGDVCLWWYANSDRDWKLDYNKPSQVITRDDDGVNMRMRFVNHPVRLKKPMEITFAVVANPVKPYRKGRRNIAWGMDNRSVALSGKRWRWHDTSGYAYWGSGVDSITCGTDKEYARTRATIDRWTGRRKPGAPKPSLPIVLYNSGQAIGHCMPEFATFSGEWRGVTPEEPNPEFPDTDRNARIPWINPNLGHQQDWRSFPHKLIPGWGALTPSMVDCRIWHYKINMEKLGINGYWYDNSPLSCFWRWPTMDNGGYQIQDGRTRPEWNVFERRALLRRLSVMYREAGKSPDILISYGPCFSFVQWLWEIEMDAYMRPGETMFDSLRKKRHYDIISNITGQEDTVLDPIGRHRAMTRMRSVAGAMSTHPDTTNPKGARSVVGLSLLHDFGVSFGVSGRVAAGFRKILTDFGFTGPDEDIEYIPYWRNEEYVKTDSKDVYVSLYKNRKTGQTLGVIANPNKRSVRCKLSLNAGNLRNPILENPEDHGIFRIAKKNGAISTAISIEDCGIALFLLREKGIRDRTFSNTGTLDREYWKAIKGRPLADVLKRGKEPDGKDRLKSFASCSWDNPNVTRNWATDFGERIRGFLIPPETGEYIFWMYSDDRGQLFISRDTRPENVRLVAEVPICGSEESQPVRLEEGKVYYVEALHAQKAGGTSFSVGWKTPFDYSKKNLHEPIPGKYLSSFSAGVPKAE